MNKNWGKINKRGYYASPKKPESTSGASVRGYYKRIERVRGLEPEIGANWTETHWGEQQNNGKLGVGGEGGGKPHSGFLVKTEMG